jgi:membrane-associated phospholipid phosphatase
VQFVTDAADQALVFPLAVCIGVMLFLLRWPRAALAWAVVVSAVFGLTLAAKLMLIPCSPEVFGQALRSPSGHTTSAAVVFGGLAGLLLPARSGRWRTAGTTAASTLIAVVIATTRLVLGQHTGPEVVVGAVIGIAGAVLLVGLAGDRPDGPLSGPEIRQLCLTALLVAVLLHGWHLPAERLINHWAFSWRLLGVCV